MTKQPEDASVQDHELLAERLIEHARAFWQAEEENARRYSNKVRVLVSIQTALLGLLLIGFPGVVAKLLQEQPTILSLVGVLFVATAVFFAAWFLLRALEFTVSRAKASKVRQLAPKSTEDQETPKLVASHYMRLPQRLLRQADQRLNRSDFVIFGRTYIAALDLQEKNARERWRLELAERHLLRGLWATAVAAVLFVLLVAAQTAGTLSRDGRIAHQQANASCSAQGRLHALAHLAEDRTDEEDDPSDLSATGCKDLREGEDNRLIRGPLPSPR